MTPTTRCANDPRRATIDEVGKLHEEVKLRMALVQSVAARDFRERKPRASRWTSVEARLQVSLDLNPPKDDPLAVASMGAAYLNRKTKGEQVVALAVAKGPTVDLALHELVKAVDGWLASRGCGDPRPERPTLIHHLANGAWRVVPPTGCYPTKGSEVLN